MTRQQLEGAKIALEENKHAGARDLKRCYELRIAALPPDPDYRALLVEAEQALTKLRNESGGLSIAEQEIRQSVGNTNWNCLALRIKEADETLARIRAALEGKRS
jgi:hypothetical protein